MLSANTIIEIIASKDGKFYKMVMTVAEWKIKPKKKGFSQFKLEK